MKLIYMASIALKNFMSAMYVHVCMYLKASRASQGWEAVSNHMWPDEPVRQAREPSEEFVGWNTLVTPRSFYYLEL